MLYCTQRDLNMKYKHVILIGIDGAGNFYRNTNAKAIRKMFSEGAGTDRCLTVYPTESAQCWGSMLTGIYPSPCLLYRMVFPFEKAHSHAENVPNSSRIF